jgi:hypothetical protein
MASPQTENGFVMIALDLFAAIMMADLPNRCMIVLSYHLIHSYGPTKKRDVFLDPATIEEHTRLHRNNVRRAVKELADAKILMRRVGGAYRFNKDYEAWMPGGKPFVGRLGGGPVEFTTWAKGAHGKPIKKSDKGPIQPDCQAVAESGDASMLDPIQPDSSINGRPNPTGLRTTVVPNPTGLSPTVVVNPTGLSQTNVMESSGIATNTDDNHIADSVNRETPSDYDETIARDRRRAPGDLENLENSSLSPNVRTSEDLALVREAMQILASHPNSGHLAERVGREHNTPDNVRLAGWKWVVAASKAFERSEGDGKPIDWPYLRGIVRNARRSEYDTIRAKSAPDPDPTTPAVNRPLSRKLTPAERRKAESEAMARAVASIPDDEEF